MRLLDIFAALAGLILLSPLLLLLAVLIKLDAPGPVFYRAVRTGKGGALFHVYKFRSMTAGVDGQGPGITSASDSRITRVGSALRQTKLDELPQLINVLKGEMSLVGPRPEDPRYVALYTTQQRQVLRVRPGMTSVASLRYRREEQLLSGPDWEAKYRREVMPSKLALDLEYLSRRTLLTDLALIWQTFLAIIGWEGSATDD